LSSFSRAWISLRFSSRKSLTEILLHSNVVPAGGCASRLRRAWLDAEYDVNRW
jgi:hypothetical protein